MAPIDDALSIGASENENGAVNNWAKSRRRELTACCEPAGLLLVRLPE